LISFAGRLLDPIAVGYSAIARLLALGVPVAVALGFAGLVGMYVGAGPAFMTGQLATLPYAVTSNYAYAVLPLFVLMGTLAELAGITRDLFRAADLWLRRVRGGLYHAVFVGSGLFSAISGSTIVNAVVFTRMALPEMLSRGYSRRLSIGAIASAGTFDAMIPPSITMVIYAVITEQSIGKLSIAGIVPGLLTVIVYMVATAVMVRMRPTLAPGLGTRAPLAERLESLKWLWPVVALVVLVLGGMYAGLFAPSAAGAVGAFGVFLIYLVRRKQATGKLAPVLADAAAVTCTIFVVLIGGLIFSRMLVVLGVIDEITSVISRFATTPTEFLILVCVMYLVLGCFIDTTSMMVVTLPFVFPLVQHYQIDPIWFGILIVKLVEIAVITPPVGFNLFAVVSAAGGRVTFADVSRGVMPYVVLELFVLALLVAVPSITLWLPQTMLGK
jgi:C4-dicarboxylate transporter, DctM subunit